MIADIQNETFKIETFASLIKAIAQDHDEHLGNHEILLSHIADTIEKSCCTILETLQK